MNEGTLLAARASVRISVHAWLKFCKFTLKVVQADRARCIFHQMCSTTKLKAQIDEPLHNVFLSPCACCVLPDSECLTLWG